MATVPSLTKRTPVAADVIYGAQSPFGGGDDAKFTMADVQNFVYGTNVTIIESMSDFPAPSAGVITLTDGLYIINAALVTSDRFLIPTGGIVRFLGTDAFAQGIIYTGTGNVFTGSDFVSFTMQEIFVSCPTGTLFNLVEPTTATGSIFIVSFAAVDCSAMGTISKMITFAVDFTAFQDCGTGLIHEDIGIILYTTVQINGWKNESTSFLTFQGTIDEILINGIQMEPNTNETCFDIKSAATIGNGTVGTCAINLSLAGDVFAAGSENETNIQWNYRGNTNIPDSIAVGSMNVPSTQTVTITTAGVPVIVNDANTGGTNIWSLGTDTRFTFSASLGRLTYIGRETINVSVFATSAIEKSGGGTDQIATLIAKNGSVVASSKSLTKNADPTSVTSLADFNMVTNDFVELAVQNDDSTSNIIVDISTFFLKS